METLLNVKKFQNVIFKIVWEFFFRPLHLEQWFKFLEKVLFLHNEECFILKHTTNKSWKSSNYTFWSKSNMRNVYRKLFKSDLFSNFHALLKHYKFEKGVEFTQKYQIIEVWRRLGQVINIFGILQWNQAKFLQKFWLSLQESYLWKENWALGSISIQFWSFLMFLNFLRC